MSDWILLVEDHIPNQRMITRRLERRGYAVRCASTGEEAIELAQSDRPALVLMDLGLPGIDGYESMRRIRQGEKTMGIPVLALTAHDTSDTRLRVMEAGFVGFQSKPIDFERLITLITPFVDAAERP